VKYGEETGSCQAFLSAEKIAENMNTAAADFLYIRKKVRGREYRFQDMNFVNKNGDDTLAYYEYKEG
jgi:hypothetical protein